MTLRELLKLVEGQPLDAPVSFKFTTVGECGVESFAEYSTAGAFLLPEDAEEWEKWSGASEVVHGFCAKSAGYEQHFVDQEGLDVWMAKFGRGRSSEACGWVPAVQLHLRVRVHA